jgi:hypothetical protein
MPRLDAAADRKKIMAKVLLLEADPTMRAFERTILHCYGYPAEESETADTALDYMRAAVEGWVVVCGNADANYRRLVLPFFLHAARLEEYSSAATRPVRHRYICLTTVPEYVPPELAAIFQRLQVKVLKKPFYPDDLVAAVAAASGQLALR